MPACLLSIPNSLYYRQIIDPEQMFRFCTITQPIKVRVCQVIIGHGAFTGQLDLNQSGRSQAARRFRRWKGLLIYSPIEMKSHTEGNVHPGCVLQRHTWMQDITLLERFVTAY